MNGQLPKINFVDMPILREIHSIGGFFPDKLPDDQGNWVYRILRTHPELEMIYSINDEQEKETFLRNYILRFRRKNATHIELCKVGIENFWTSTEKRDLTLLSEAIEIAWPAERPVITALVSINPICPRFLDDWSFSLFATPDMGRAMETILHECCHFLYFEKWKEVFPNSDPETFNAPHQEWILSELSAPIILRKKLGLPKARFYNEYCEVIIEGKRAPQFFTGIFLTSRNFEAFLRKAYKKIKKYSSFFPDIRAHISELKTVSEI